MSRWDEPLPPNHLSRWVARHLRPLQAGCVILGLGSAVLVLTSIQDEGWGRSAVIGIPNSIVFVGLVIQFQAIASAVARYDKGRSVDVGD